MSTKNYIHIFVDTSEDAMTGSEGWGNVDEKDTVNKFSDLILKEVCEMFPGADVEIETYAPNQHTETDMEGDGYGTYAGTVEEEVQEVISRIYNDGEFWPESAQQDDAANTVTLNESGYDTGMTFKDYCTEAAKYGDNPADWSTDIDDFVFVGWEYAQNDPRWTDTPENWPESLPLWEYRPA